ncbi:MAG TPA: VWA domain-containing protein [Pyrinomonadaceae bacterium]|nr:VWA domain-containing protein [Pyrinomonadaceae bacterium]
MKIKQKLLLFLIGALSVVAVHAQEEPIRIGTELVTVNVAVTDSKGKPVAGLKPEQFEIFDNKTKQQISHFSAEEAPVVFGIVYDLHPTTEERMTAVLDSLRTFTKNLKEEDRFFLTAFNHYGSLNVEFIPTAEQIEKNLSVSSKAREPNSLYDAIYAAADKLRESKSLKRTLLVISDSADHNSRHSFSDLSRQLKKLDVQLYAVIFDESEMWSFSDITRSMELSSRGRVSNDATKLDRVALEELTLKSGGTSHFPVTQNSLELFNIYRRIDAEMRRFYTLSFYPAVSDDKWHEIKVGLRSVEGSKRFALTYRRGYQSSGQRR